MTDDEKALAKREKLKELEAQLMPAVIEKQKSIAEMAKEALPMIKYRHDMAVGAMDNWKKAENEEEYEQNNALLVRIKKTYDLMSDEEKPIMEAIDTLYEMFRQYKRPLDYSTKAKSRYNECRQDQEKYKQEELDRKNKEKAAAAERKRIEDEKVNLASRIRTNLNNLISEKIRKTSDWCSNFFKDATVATFPELEKKFTTVNPKLNNKDYDACFIITDAPLDEAVVNEVIVNVLKEEPWEKWNKEMNDKVGPIMNEWRARMPDIKQQLIVRENASSEEEKKKIEAEQERRRQEEDRKRKAELAKMEELREQELEAQRQRDLLHNSFQEQATSQQIGDGGPTKKVMKFSDPKNATSLSHVLYAVFSSPKFEGIEKRDKNKNVVFDSQGRPEYIDAVQFWINKFLSIADQEKFKIQGAVYFEDAKVAVRK